VWILATHFPFKTSFSYITNEFSLSLKITRCFLEGEGIVRLELAPTSRGSPHVVGETRGTEEKIPRRKQRKYKA
jgi:hypothetical protein